MNGQIFINKTNRAINIIITGGGCQVKKNILVIFEIEDKTVDGKYRTVLNDLLIIWIIITFRQYNTNILEKRDSLMADGTISNALSGLKAAEKRMQASAHNTANVNTDGFKKKVVKNSSVPGGGVESSVSVNDSHGIPVRDPGTGEIKEGSNVDLAEETVNRISASGTAKANTNSIKARDEMLGNILDIKK